MAKDVHSTLNFTGGAKVTGLPSATGAGEPIVFEQFNAALEGIAWKDDVVAASTANINLSSPGSTIDGVTMASGDRFLAKDQSTGSQNGIYIWNGASSAATRAADMSASAEFNSAVVPVKAGSTNAGTQWRQTAADPTVGSTSIVFTAFLSGAGAASESSAGIAEIATQGETDAGSDDTRIVTPNKLANYSGRAKRYAVDVGDGSNTSITVTHNLNTRDVQVVVRRNSGAYDEVLVDWGAATVNTVVLVFATAPSSAQFRCIVLA
jgi:hypothetical protein